MGERKSQLFLCGLLLIIATARGVDCACTPFNFKELEDSVFKVEIEMSESRSGIVCKKLQPGDSVLPLKDEDNLPCPQSLLQLIGNAKYNSIKKVMEESKRRKNWWGDKAFVLDIYYTVMEINFMRDPNLSNDGFQLNIKTTSKMRGHLYTCCLNESSKPNHFISFETFNVAKEGASSSLFDFTNLGEMGVQVNEGCSASVFGPQCWMPQAQVKAMVGEENKMFGLLLGATEVHGRGSVQVLKTALPEGQEIIMRNQTETTLSSPSMIPVWIISNENFYSTFLGKNVINVTPAIWQRVYEYKMPASSASMTGVDANLGVFTMIISTFVLYFF